MDPSENRFYREKEEPAENADKLSDLETKLREEQENYAALQARCFEGFPSVSEGIFDALKEAENTVREQGEEIARLKEMPEVTYNSSVSAWMGRAKQVEKDLAAAQATIAERDSEIARTKNELSLVRSCFAEASHAAGPEAVAAEMKLQARIATLEVEKAALEKERGREARDCEQVMAERDGYHKWADRLAACAGGVEVIGEHSNMNDPWENAEDILTGLPAEHDALRAKATALEAKCRDLRKLAYSIFGQLGSEDLTWKEECVRLEARLRAMEGAKLVAEKERDEWKACAQARSDEGVILLAENDGLRAQLRAAKDALLQFRKPENWTVKGRFNPHSHSFDGLVFAQKALAQLPDLSTSEEKPKDVAPEGFTEGPLQMVCVNPPKGHPDAVAPGHNPDGLTNEQVGEGWRLLETDEVTNDAKSPMLDSIELWMNRGKYWDTSGNRGWQMEATYRTRLSREELAKARNQQEGA